MNRSILAPLVLFAYTGAFGQSADKLSFEVASVKPSPPPDGRGITVFCKGGPGTDDPVTFTCQNMTLSNLISSAYGVAYYQLSAPDWLSGRDAMFHVSARVPPGTTKEQFQAMLQNLLADRFKLVVHHETRDLQKYDLVLGKGGARFKEAAPPKNQPADAPRPQASFSPRRADKDGFPNVGPDSPGMAMMSGKARMFQPEMTMERLASQLSAQLAKPVTDATGLKGKYEIGLYWVSAPSRAAAAPADGAAPEDPGPTLIDAVRDQLGLRLESKKGPVDFLVVDRAEKTPSEN